MIDKQAAVKQRKIDLMSRGFLLSDERCPDCAAPLYARRHDHYSHDGSYKTGYTRETQCPECGYGEIYHDVE